MYLLHHLLTGSSLKYPERTAVVFKDTTITYADLEAKSSLLALTLSRQGVGKGDRVGIMLNKSIESIIALFGILKTGAMYVPLDPQTPSGRADHIIALCGIECLITSRNNLKKTWAGGQIPQTLKKAVLTGPAAVGTAFNHIDALAWDAAQTGPLDGYCPAEPSDTCPAYILHTSGSTGTPKGVVISHLNALSFIHMASRLFALHEGDRIANHAPLHFDLSVFDIFGAIGSGAALVLVPEFLSPFPARLAEYIDRQQITIWNSVSSVLTMLAERGKLDRFGFDALRLVHFSGDVMPVKYLRILRKHMKTASFYNIYGQTEANSSLYYPVRQIPDNDAWKIPIGKTFPNFEVFAVNKANEVVSSPGEEGELYVSGSTVALGYWNDEQMTSEKFTADPRTRPWPTRVYRTGDLVRIDEDGSYLFVGRRDHMVKSRGYRIELAEIEIVLNSHADVSRAVVIPVADELTGNRIIAYVSLQQGADSTAEEISAYCSTLLPRYMVPEEILFIDTLSKTTTGKVDRTFMTETYLRLSTPAGP